jgi:hypothetical protein
VELPEHALRGVDADDLDAALRQGDRDPAGSHAELERPAAARDLGEELDVARCGPVVRQPLVVDVGPAVAVRRRVVPAHAESIAVRKLRT